LQRSRYDFAEFLGIGAVGYDEKFAMIETIGSHRKRRTGERHGKGPAPDFAFRNPGSRAAGSAFDDFIHLENSFRVLVFRRLISFLFVADLVKGLDPLEVGWTPHVLEISRGIEHRSDIL
jgi:hypothetical protein